MVIRHRPGLNLEDLERWGLLKDGLDANHLESSVVGHATLQIFLPCFSGYAKIYAQ